MFLPLKTINIWLIRGEFAPETFFPALKTLGSPSDILVVGSYDVVPVIYDWLIQNCIDLNAPPFYDSFEWNRDEYPRGRSYALTLSSDNVRKMVEFCGIPCAGIDSELFFDHVALYRPGTPIVPLMQYHDAMKGDLHLSGHYSKEVSDKFAKLLGGVASVIANPEGL